MGRATTTPSLVGPVAGRDPTGTGEGRTSPASWAARSTISEATRNSPVVSNGRSCVPTFRAQMRGRTLCEAVVGIDWVAVGEGAAGGGGAGCGRGCVTPADATGVQPEDIRANIYGTEYQKGPLRLLGEFESHVSNINPFNALRLSADLTHNMKNAGTARLRTRWVDIDRSAPQNRRTKMLTVDGRYRQRVGEYLTVEGAALYRRDNDSLSGDRRGLDLDLSLEWVIRDTELRATYKYGRFEDDFAENKNQTLFVQFRRRF